MGSVRESSLSLGAWDDVVVKALRY